MNHFKVSVLAVLLPGCLSAFSAAAEPLTLGASVIYAQSPYKSGQDRYYPVPVINYEGENFYFRSLQAGYYLWKDTQDQLSLTVLGSPQNYDPDESDDGDMRALDKRHMTLMAGAAYRHTADWGTVRTALVGDVLNNSNGVIWDLTYLYPVTVGDFRLTPGIGALWNSANQNRYYYGVSGNESARTGLNSYHPGDSWSPYLELGIDYKINASWRANVVGRYTRFADEIKDSPMVDTSSQTVVWTGLSYTF